jgi:hypothetical protein
MDEALRLTAYLPLGYRNRDEEAYIDFLWSTFQFNYEAEKYEFASFAFHLLYMTYMSFLVWQIRVARPVQFGHALIGFQREAESDLLGADSPFKFYDRMKESQIFRFLKIIGCENEQVGEIGKFVRRRNKIAHPTGTVFFNDRETIDEEITAMMREVEKLEAQTVPLVLDIYRRFLAESADAEEREYGTDIEEIEANLIHRYYMSRKDVEACKALDLAEFREHPAYQGIIDLHESLGVLVEPVDPLAETNPAA